MGFVKIRKKKKRNKARDASRALEMNETKKKEKGRTRPEMRLGPCGDGKKEKRRKTRARDTSRALVVVMLVLREEGGGLKTHFDASRAPVARRRGREGGRGSRDASKRVSSLCCSSNEGGREGVSRCVLTRLEPLVLVKGVGDGAGDAGTSPTLKTSR